MAENDENHSIIVKKSKEYYEVKAFKKILSEISNKFVIDNIVDIYDVTFDFEMEIPEDKSYKLPRNIINYKSKDEDNLLEIFNEILWLYYQNNKNFKEDFEYFRNIVDELKSHSQFELTEDLFSVEHIKIFNQIAIENKNKKNFEEFIKNFYVNYGFDLREYFKTVVYSNKNVYYSKQLDTNKNKLLNNITNLANYSINSRDIVSNLYSSKPMHKLLKAHSIFIEINPLLPKNKLIKILDDNYNIYNKFKEIFEYFELESDSEYDESGIINSDSSSKYSMKENNDIKSNTPTSIQGVEIIQKSIIIHSIMKYYELNDIHTAIRYFNYFIIRNNVKSLFIDNQSLIHVLKQEKYELLEGKIYFKKPKSINILQKGKTKIDIINLTKLLNQYL